MVSHSKSYSYGFDPSKTEPLNIQNKMVAILLRISVGFGQNGLHFVQNRTPLEHGTPFINGTQLDNPKEGYHCNSEHVRYSSPHCCSQGGVNSRAYLPPKSYLLHIFFSFPFLFPLFETFCCIFNCLLTQIDADFQNDVGRLHRQRQRCR